jgi:hypothetical protein
MSINLIKKYLEKLGVKEFSQLNDDEKETYRDWEEALLGKKITDEDVAIFLVATENAIIEELVDNKTSEKRDLFLKMQLDLIRKIKQFLSSPALEKKLTEININNLLKS